MLDMKKQDDKTFEEWWEESLQKIPMYSSEWTNFNPSDPGITILEHFIVFHMLQQSRMEKTTPEVVEKLLKMAGILRYPGRCARVLLEFRQPGEPVAFPANQQFSVGETIFETEKPCRVGGHKLIGVYGMAAGKILDAQVLLQEEIPMSVRIFGNHPKAGDAVYFIMDSLPEGEELYFYVHVVKTPYRNDFVESVNQHFAAISWQCYSKEGFRDIRCKNKTGSFLSDGELVFSGIQGSEVYHGMPKEGYCIRGVLMEAAYDIPPQLLSVHGFLLEAFQHKTGCVVKNFRKGQRIEVNCNLLEDGYFRVYCRERDEKFYRRYDSYDGTSKDGRYYEFSQDGERQITINFNKQRFRYGPVRGKDAVRVVIYTEEMMQRYDLGMVYGYDNQTIQLPVKHVVPENFCLLAGRQDGDGGVYYDFVKPGRDREGDLKYELLEEEGAIRILDAGEFIEARLFLACISTCQGEAGNVRENSSFTAKGPFGELELANPVAGMGGRLKESVKMAAKRFYEEMKRPETAVCAEDYERMVQKAAGLCIQKVRAVMDYDKNEALVIVKPWSQEPFPELTPLYQDMLEKYFEPRRLLGARIRFASPRYVGIDVRGVIYVKRHYEHYMEEIESVLKKHLDYRDGRQNFGETLRFEKLFSELEHLDCMVSVQSLVIYPQDYKKASVIGMDIHPAKDCLCYPGDFYLDIHAGQPLGG